MKKRALKVIEHIHFKLFHHAPSPEMLSFLRDLSFVTIAAIISKALLFGTRVYGGNVAGPEVYGAFSLILSISGLLSLPLYIFQQGSTRFIAESKDNQSKDIYFSSVFWFVLLVATPLVILVYLISKNSIIGLLNISEQLFIFSLVFVILTYLSSYFESVLRAYNKFDTESIISSMAHIVMFISFLLISFYYSNILLFVISYIILYSVKLLSSLYLLLPSIRFEISFAHLKNILGYGIWAFLIYLFHTILSYIDKIVINKYLSAEAVGLFQAYYDSSVVITATIIGLVLTVLSTKLFMIEDKGGVVTKLKKISRILLIFDITIVPIAIYLIVFFGFQFEIKWEYILAFTLLTIVTNKMYIWNNFFYVLKIETIKKMVLVLSIIIILNLAGNLFFVPRFGIVGSIITTVFCEIFLLFSLTREIKKAFLKLN